MTSRPTTRASTSKRGEPVYGIELRRVDGQVSLRDKWGDES